MADTVRATTNTKIMALAAAGGYCRLAISVESAETTVAL
jgi:hypothetical protein